ncbi:unnamed protein product [Closterium sp. NIES-54]
MHVDVISAEGACYSCVPCAASEPADAQGASESAAGLGASESTAALGASASAATCASESAAIAEALHTFTHESGASRCFFRYCTTVTPLVAPVPVSLADPSGGPVVPRASTVLPCPAAPSGALSALHLPSFSTNLVSNTFLHDVWVDTFIPGRQRVAICTCSWTGRYRATFTRQPGSSLYTLTTASAQVAASVSVDWTASVDTSASPRAAPHSSSFPLTTAPLQTLHMDQSGRLQCFDPLDPRYSSPAARAVLARPSSLPSALLAGFCRDEGIIQSFMLPASPHQNGIAEHRSGLIMEVARTSIIHAAAPHFLWPFAVQYAAHQLNH